VTAVPEVVSVPLQASPPSGPSKRFFVLATNGLFDKLTNDEVVGLVGGWLDGQRGTRPRSHVLSYVSPADPSIPAHQPQPPRDPSDDSDFVFQDDNVATHLIRNALGGSNTDQVRALLSIRAPYARFQRDDVSYLFVSLLRFLVT
jgi:pyruvate dehydrogenase phosphatase